MVEGDAERRKPSLIVGIGASAGGLDAVKRFLGAMPPDTGMAFVLVMHLDPDRESQIASILKLSTEMEVEQGADNQPIEPNHVYVIAPRAVVEIREGTLRSSKPSDKRERHKPIDVFFTSLAADRTAGAAAVILSGAGDNGSAGIRDIKARGALCLAQEPETAQYDAMPRNAIATGVVDHVLPPEEMPALLVRYLEEPTAFGPEGEEGRPTAEPKAFDLILDLLGRSYGVNFRTAYKRGTLERRADRRKGFRQLSDWESYLDVLREDAQEVDALYRDILIGVTEFFRDPEVWNHLEKEAIPHIVDQHDEGVPIKIWVPGCATGEEPYSLAMVFLEELERTGRQTKLQIFASDIATDALTAGRRGIYPPTIERTVSPERLSRFFRREGESYTVTRQLRESVTFAAHNLLADPPFSKLELVSCRNVLIYLEAHAQQRVLEVFYFALKPGGLLLLGSSETVGRHDNLFDTLSNKVRLYRSKAGSEAARHHSLFRGHEMGPLRDPVAVLTPADSRRQLGRIVEQIVLNRYTQACVVVTESFEIRSFFGPTDEFLVQPTGEARMDLLAWVMPGFYATLRSALERARNERERVQAQVVRVGRHGASRSVECTVEPLTPTLGGSRLYLVAFKELPPPPPADVSGESSSDDSIVHQLEAQLKHSQQELLSTVEQLEGTNEVYRASHEELLSLNEELQSNNEELEASKEELQSLNEEMTTINRQLEEKNIELQATNDDLSNLLMSTSLPIIFLNRELRIRRFTPAATALMRLVPSDVGRSVEHVKERFRDASLMSDARRVLETLTPITSEVRAENDRWYVRTVRPYRTEDDRIDGVCLSFHDVTDAKEAARTIDEGRRYAEAIVDATPTPLVVLDEELTVRSANRAFYRAFQVDEADTVGQRLYDLGNRQWNIPHLRELLEEVLPREAVVRDFEVEHDFQTIGRRVMLLNARRMSRENGRPLILLAIDDVTTKRAADRMMSEHADDLEAESRRKDEFLAMLGHELRNPLSALMHGVDLVGLTRDDPARIDHIRGMMLRQGSRIGAMLDQLLDIARLSSGKVKIERVRLNLVEAIQTAIESVSPLVQSRNHELVVSWPPDVPVIVEGDAYRLTQAVENLLANAAKYTQEGGRIELTLETDESTARIRVRDDGIGMDGDLIPHIFELFTQDTRALDRAAGGLGLGLPLVQRVIEAHGGRVEASSPGRGEGSEFVITLGRVPGRATAEGSGTADPDRSGERLRILVVDDETDAADVLTELLSARGHDTRTAYDGHAALELLDTYLPDVVLLDLGLPGMDGYEVAGRMRHQVGADTLIIAITGYSEDTDRLSQAGFDGHLIKPLDTKKLSRWLAGQSADREA